MEENIRLIFTLIEFVGTIIDELKERRRRRLERRRARRLAPPETGRLTPH